MLHAAYDDAAGITAAFNKNVLAVLNARLGANFDLAAFDHVALWDPARSGSRCGCARTTEVTLPAIGLTVAFAEGEEMRTEVSAKFRRDGVAAELSAAGFAMRHWWTDDGGQVRAVAVGARLTAGIRPRTEASPGAGGRRALARRAAPRSIWWTRTRQPQQPGQFAATRSPSIAPQLNRSTAIRFSSGQVWMARCDSARMSTRVTAPLGKITWLVSSTWPPPAWTAAVAAAVSSAMSATGEPG